MKAKSGQVSLIVVLQSDSEDDSDYEGLILFVGMEKRRSRQRNEDQISIGQEKMEYSHCAWVEFEKIAKKWFPSV